MPSTATLTSVAATTVALRGAPSRIASSPKWEPGPTRPTSWPSLVHDRLALEDDEQGVARLTFPDEIDAGGQLGRLRVAGDRLALPLRAAREEPDLGQQLLEFSLRPHAGPLLRPGLPSERVAASRAAHATGRSVPAHATGRHPTEVRRVREGRQVRRLALFVVHRRWVVIVAAVLFLPLAALVGGGVQKS